MSVKLLTITIDVLATKNGISQKVEIRSVKPFGAVAELYSTGMNDVLSSLGNEAIAVIEGELKKLTKLSNQHVH